MARIDSFLRLVVEQGASDLHFDAGKAPVIRHDGDLVSLPFRPLSEAETRRFLNEMLTPEERLRLDDDSELDTLYTLDGVGRFRVNVFQQLHGLGAAFRIIPDRPPDLTMLGFPLAVERLTELQSGLVLIGGPTGSGKTTTLAAIVNHINRTQRRHLITVEDPIEFLHDPIKSAVTQRQVGEHIESWSEALRSALREAPDALVVGELRDAETLLLAVQAAETGVLVFGTLHTSSAPKTISRIIDMVPEESREQLRLSLATLLRGVVAQHLVRRQNGDGRIAAVEVLLGNQAISSLLRENKVLQIESYLQSQQPHESGMQSLDTCLMRYLRDGIVSADEALSVAHNPELIKRFVAQLSTEAER